MGRLSPFLLLTLAAVAQPTGGLRVERDVVYARAGQKELLLDLYLPAAVGAGRLPVIVWVHGGAWRSGSKEDCPARGQAARGYAVASVNYRLSQEAIFPAQIHDLKAAVRWLRANADRYGLDSDRIGAWGASAGGHLVALLGTSGGVKDLEGDLGDAGYSSRVQAVVDFFGPTDLPQMSKFSSAIDHDSPDSPESRLLGGPVQQNKDRAARANPITYVTKDDPPFLIMHGDRDPLVPLNQSELLHAALRNAGVESSLEVVKGGGHGFRGPEVDAAVERFFDRPLKSRP